MIVGAIIFLYLRPARKEYAKAISDWENEGGAVCQGSHESPYLPIFSQSFTSTCEAIVEAVEQVQK